MSAGICPPGQSEPTAWTGLAPAAAPFAGPERTNRVKTGLAPPAAPFAGPERTNRVKTGLAPPAAPFAGPGRFKRLSPRSS